MLALPSKYSQKPWVKISTAIISVHSISTIILLLIILIIISLIYSCNDLLQVTLLPLSPPTVCSPPSGPSSPCHPFKIEVKSCHSSAQNESKFTSSLFIGEKKSLNVSMIPSVPHFSDLMEWLLCPPILLQQPHWASYVPVRNKNTPNCGPCSYIFFCLTSTPSSYLYGLLLRYHPISWFSHLHHILFPSTSPYFQQLLKQFFIITSLHEGNITSMIAGTVLFSSVPHSLGQC